MRSTQIGKTLATNVSPSSVQNDRNKVILNIIRDPVLEATTTDVAQELLSNEIHSGIYMIEVHTKIWRPKVISKYTTPHLEDDDVDDISDCGRY